MGAQLGTPLEAVPGTISAQQSSLSQLSHTSSLWEDADRSPSISKAAFLSHDSCIHPAPCSAAANTSAAHPVAPCYRASPAAPPRHLPKSSNPSQSWRQAAAQHSRSVCRASPGLLGKWDFCNALAAPPPTHNFLSCLPRAKKQLRESNSYTCRGRENGCWDLHPSPTGGVATSGCNCSKWGFP